MADVITSQPKSVAVAAPSQLGDEIRKYAVEFIGAFFLTFVVGVAALSGSVFTPLAARHPDGHDLRRRPHLRRPLQPGGDAGGPDPRPDRAT